MRRLNEGDKVEIHGDPLLADLNPGVYWIDYVTWVSGVPVYGVRKYRCRKIQQQLAASVDPCVGNSIKVIA
jgi:hypothetical protein